MVSFEFPKRSRIFRKFRARSPIPFKGGQESRPVGSTSEDLWGRAYNKLSNDHKGLVKHYEQILCVEEAEIKTDDNPSTSGSIAHSPNRLTELAKRKLNALDDSRWQVSIRSKTFVVQDGVDKFVKCLSAARDFVDQIVSSEPHAALAWAGVCICLPLLLNPSKQYDDAQAGLLEIPTIIIRYQVLEPMYRNLTVHIRAEHKLKAKFERKLTELYCNILQYQIRAVCQWSRKKTNQYIRDVFKADEWSKLFKDIQIADTACMAIGETFNAGTLDGLNGRHLRLHDKVDSFHLTHQDTLNNLSSMVESLEAAETQRQQQQTREEQEEEQRCHQTFGPSIYLEHKNRNPVRVPGTCNWFLNSENFTTWKNQKQSCVLWVSADPGCGKSVLTRSTIDEGLLHDNNQASTVCYFFFKDGLVQQQGAAKCVSALLHQIFTAKPILIKHAIQAYRVNGSNISNSFSVTWEILIAAALDPHAGEIICVLDALDECEEEDRYLLIDTLKGLYGGRVRQEPAQLKFLVTSRPYTDIQRRFTALTDAFPTVHLKGEHESEAISKEINLVICKVVPDIARELKLSADAEVQLRDRLLEVPNRTYLWLHLALEEVRRSVGATTAKRVNRLVSGLISNVPRTVEDAYDKILNRDYKKYFEDRRRLLALVLAALRPLTLAEASIALPLTKIGSDRTTADLDPEDEQHFRITVQALCGLFVSVVDGKLFLLHQTAREYLLRPHSYNGGNSLWKHTFDLKNAQYMIAKCCIYYLRFKEFESCDSSKVDLESMKTQHPFLAYAAYYWTQHYVDYDQNALFDMALDLCKPRSTYYETWRLVRHSCATEQGIDKSSMYDWSPLMVAARFGFNVMTTKLLEEGEDPAAEYGHSLVVKTLLDAKSIVGSSNEGISHALSYACEGGYFNAAALLLSRGADVKARGRGATPLHYAVQEEHVDVVRLLLGYNNVQIDAAGGLWGTPLQISAYKNFMEIAKLLLENGANPNLNRRDDDGSLRGVPIALAASAGNLGMIQLLKEYEADVNGSVGVGNDWLADSTRNFRCDSPLMMAASEQKLDAMDFLLNLGTDLRQKVPQRAGASGNAYADTMDVFEKVCCVSDGTKSMKFLLEYEKEANPDIPKIALLAAARYGDFPMLDLILEECPPFQDAILVEALEILNHQIGATKAPIRLSKMLTMRSLLEEKLPKDIEIVRKHPNRFIHGCPASSRVSPPFLNDLELTGHSV